MSAAGSSFETWARAVVQAGARSLVQAVEEGGRAAELGGEGGPRSTGRGYRSHYVTLTTPRLGRIAIWLYAVPAGHEYGTSVRQSQLGAGLMHDSDRVVDKDALGP